MSEMKTITINGNTYTVADPDAAHIDNAKIGNDAWSSKKIIDQLCPAFTGSGAGVTCEPVEGYPLEVISSFLPLPATGAGDPSPENTAQIDGIASLWLTIGEGDGKGVDFGDTIYGGTYNWGTGILTVEWVKKTLTGGFQSGTGNVMACALAPAPLYDPAVATVLCSNYRGYGWTALWTAQDNADTQGVAAGTNVLRLVDNVNFAGDAAALNAYLAENPMEIVYKLAEPYTVQLDPQQIYAVAGENTLAVDHGTITVTGRTLPDNSTVELDTTLSAEGKAADAAAVGAAIGDIETALDGILAIQNELIGGDA